MGVATDHAEKHAGNDNPDTVVKEVKTDRKKKKRKREIEREQEQEQKKRVEHWIMDTE